MAEARGCQRPRGAWSWCVAQTRARHAKPQPILHTPVHARIIRLEMQAADKKLARVGLAWPRDGVVAAAAAATTRHDAAARAATAAATANKNCTGRNHAIHAHARNRAVAHEAHARIAWRADRLLR